MTIVRRPSPFGKPRQIEISPLSNGQAAPAVEASASGGNGSGS